VDDRRIQKLDDTEDQVAIKGECENVLHWEWKSMLGFSVRRSLWITLVDLELY
jgi:hypothetical protein